MNITYNVLKRLNPGNFCTGKLGTKNPVGSLNLRCLLYLEINLLPYDFVYSVKSIVQWQHYSHFVSITIRCIYWLWFFISMAWSKANDTLYNLDLFSLLWGPKPKICDLLTLPESEFKVYIAWPILNETFVSRNPKQLT